MTSRPRSEDQGKGRGGAHRDTGKTRRRNTIFVMVKCDLGKPYEVTGATVERIEEFSEIHYISG